MHRPRSLVKRAKPRSLLFPKRCSGLTTIAIVVSYTLLWPVITDCCTEVLVPSTKISWMQFLCATRNRIFCCPTRTDPKRPCHSFNDWKKCSVTIPSNRAMDTWRRHRPQTRPLGDPLRRAFGPRENPPTCITLGFKTGDYFTREHHHPWIAGALSWMGETVEKIVWKML